MSVAIQTDAMSTTAPSATAFATNSTASTIHGIGTLGTRSTFPFARQSVSHALRERAAPVPIVAGGSI